MEKPINEDPTMTTKNELEQKFEHTYYFKINDQNPLMLREPGQTIRLGNQHFKIQATGQVKINGEQHGFLAGSEVTE